MAPNDKVIDAEIDEASQPTDAEMSRGLAIISQIMHRKKALENEKILKGLYVDFVFDRLNLTKYR